MSYIDDLEQAAAEALAASSSATDSAQIMADVANGDENTTVTTANGEVKTLAKAIKDIIDTIEAGVEAPQVEPQTLSAGQTTVTLSTMTTEGIAVYVEGSREFDFTVVNSTDFEFGESFPDGTRIWVVKRDIEGVADSFTVNTSTGSQTLSNALDNRVIYVDTIADLQALDTSGLVDGQVINVKEWHAGSDFGGSSFYYSAGESKDSHGFLGWSPSVPSPENQSGASDVERRDNFLDGVGETDPGGTGLFVFSDTKRICVSQFGTFADNTKDDWKAIDFALKGPSQNVYLPPKEHFSTRTFNMKKRVLFEGAVGFGATNSPSVITFDNFANGFIIHRGDTNADDFGKNQVVEPTTTSAEGSIIGDMRIRRMDGSDPVSWDEVSHGIQLKGRACIKNMRVSGFQGNGIHIVATAGAADPTEEGNANNWAVSNVRCENNWKGYFSDGADSNAGTSIGLDCSSNGSYGMHESSFLGNTHIGSHNAANGDKAILSEGNNSHSTYINPYIEGGGTAVFDAAEGHYLIGGIMPGATKLGGFYSLAKLPDYISGTADIQDLAAQVRPLKVRNTSELGSSTATALDLVTGSVGGSPFPEVKLGAVNARSSSSLSTEKTSIALQVHDGAGSYEDAVEANGRVSGFYPGSDGAWALGIATKRWSELRAVEVRTGDGSSVWTSGAGSPEGVVTANVGSMFTRTDGGAGTTLYVKESGAGNTGWVAK